jgi:hypothetical protein
VVGKIRKRLELPESGAIQLPCSHETPIFLSVYTRAMPSGREHNTIWMTNEILCDMSETFQLSPWTSHDTSSLKPNQSGRQ